MTRMVVQHMNGAGTGRVRWALMLLLFLVAAVSYLDRSNVSIAVSAIQADFGLSNVQMGGVFSAFVMGYAFSQPIAGYIADRYGPRRVVALGILWWSLFTAMTAWLPSDLAWSAGLLLAVRFLLGVGEAVIFPASNRLVSSWIPSAERGRATGIIFAGVGFGAGVAPPLITFLSLQRGWRWSFYVTALVGLAVFVLWTTAARDRPEQHPWMGQDELAHIRADLPSTSTVAPRAPFLWIFRNREVMLLGASYFTYGYVAYIFFTWFFKYLSTVRGLDLKSSASYAILPFVAMALAAPLGGWVGDRLSRRWGVRRGRCWTASACLAAAAIFVMSSTHVGDARLASLVLTGGAGALYLSQSAYWALTADIGGAAAGSVSGVVNMLNQMGGVITASLTPYLADHYGWSVSFEVAAALCLVGAVIWLFIRPEVPGTATARTRG